jgi:hypothetical protein
VASCIGGQLHRWLGGQLHRWPAASVARWPAASVARWLGGSVASCIGGQRHRWLGGSVARWLGGHAIPGPKIKSLALVPRARGRSLPTVATRCARGARTWGQPPWQFPCRGTVRHEPTKIQKQDLLDSCQPQKPMFKPHAMIELP